MLKGSSFEKLIDDMNQIYVNKGYGWVQKIATPMKVLGRRGANFMCCFDNKKSSFDYFGYLKGIPVAFEAKETKSGRLPLSCVKEHQLRSLKQAMKGGALTFIIVSFLKQNKILVFPLENYIKSLEEEGKKSLSYDELHEMSHVVKNIDYLKVLEKKWPHLISKADTSTTKT